MSYRLTFRRDELIRHRQNPACSLSWDNFVKRPTTADHLLLNRRREPDVMAGWLPSEPPKRSNACWRVTVSAASPAPNTAESKAFPPSILDHYLHRETLKIQARLARVRLAKSSTEAANSFTTRHVET
jgi:hypothetical protein